MGFFKNFPYTNFHDLNLDWILNKIKEIENRIPEKPYEVTGQLSEFDGDTVEEKLESFFKQDVVHVVTVGNITVSRPVYIPADKDRRLFKLVDGTITLRCNMFAQNGSNYLPGFNNIHFKGNGYTISKDAGFIGLCFYNCTFNNCAIYKKTSGYIQSLYLMGCKFCNQVNVTVQAPQAYDTKIIGCQFESSGTSDIVIRGGQAYNVTGLSISDCLFEGYTAVSPIVLGSCFNAKIDGCYFEQNYANIEFTDASAMSVVSNNMFSGTLGNYEIVYNIGTRAPFMRNNVFNSGKPLAGSLDNKWWAHNLYNYDYSTSKYYGTTLREDCEYTFTDGELSIPFKLASSEFYAKGGACYECVVNGQYNNSSPWYVGVLHFYVYLYTFYNSNSGAVEIASKAVVIGGATKNTGTVDNAAITVEIDDVSPAAIAVSGKIKTNNFVKVVSARIVDKFAFGSLAKQS